MERCADCRFWERGDAEGIEGECHRLPPVIELVEGGLASMWPTSAYNRWCGEFQEKITG